MKTSDVLNLSLIIPLIHATGDQLESGGAYGVCVQRDGSWKKISNNTATSLICERPGTYNAVQFCYFMKMPVLYKTINHVRSIVGLLYRFY